MKTLDRYLLHEMSAPFFIGLAGFLTVLCFNMAYFVLDLIVEKEAPVSQIIGIIALRIPCYLVLALPVAVLLASSLAVNRLTRDREIIALRLAGLSLWRILAPYAAVGTFLSIFSFTIQEWAAPRATHASDTLYRELLVESNVPSLTPDTFFRVDNRVFYFRGAYRSGKHSLRLTGVMMYDLSGSLFPEIWSAREALVQADVWTLKDVVVHHLDNHGGSSVDAVPPSDVTMDLHKDMGALMGNQKSPEEMTATELLAQLRAFRRMGINLAGLSSIQYEYYSKFTLPVACLICALIGIPLNIRYARLGGFIGLFLALVAVFLYYNVMLFARSFALNGTIPAIVGACFPDALFGLICLFFIRREL